MPTHVDDCHECCHTGILPKSKSPLQFAQTKYIFSLTFIFLWNIYENKYLKKKYY